MTRLFEVKESSLVEKKCLEEEVDGLRTAATPPKDESNKVKAFKTHANFVARVQVLESDCMEATTMGFNTAMSQLTLLNPRLNTKGVRLLSQVVDGKLFHPPDSPNTEDDGRHEE